MCLSHILFYPYPPVSTGGFFIDFLHLDKCKIGVNATPFHNRCRGTKCPYFNNEFTLNTKRAVRDKDGNTVMLMM